MADRLTAKDVRKAAQRLGLLEVVEQRLAEHGADPSLDLRLDALGRTTGRADLDKALHAIADPSIGPVFAMLLAELVRFEILEAKRLALGFGRYLSDEQEALAQPMLSLLKSSAADGAEL